MCIWRISLKARTQDFQPWNSGFKSPIRHAEFFGNCKMEDVGMDLEAEKKEFVDYLNEIENEARTLINRIEKLKSELQNVKTQEDIDRFNAENDMGNGFKHIELF